MAQDFPSEGERKAFVEKLAQFRSTLQPSEQRMLDAMAAAAFTPQGQDVQGYGVFAPGPVPGTSVYQPTWFIDGYTYDWVATPFGMTWQAVPHYRLG